MTNKSPFKTYLGKCYSSNVLYHYNKFKDSNTAKCIVFLYKHFTDNAIDSFQGVLHARWTPYSTALRQNRMHIICVVFSPPITYKNINGEMWVFY